MKTSNLLPKHLNVRRLSKQATQLQGQCPLAELPRIGELFPAGTTPSGAVFAELNFAIDKKGRQVITGYIETQLVLTCQRCLGPLAYPIRENFSLIPADSGANKASADDEEQCEVILLDDGIMDVYALIEEEIILALPQIPMHEDLNCINSLKN